MMHKASGVIALLLIAAIILLPVKDSPDNGLVSVSPQTVCGDTARNDTIPIEDNENDTTKIIAVVVIVIIVIFIVYCITGTENQSTVRR